MSELIAVRSTDLGAWIVCPDGSQEALSTHASESDAEQAAQAYALDHGGHVTVRDRYERIHACQPIADDELFQRRITGLSPGTLTRESSPPTIRIVLADDHAVVRSGLRMLLEAEPGFEVAAEAGDVDAARRYVRGHHPAVLVLDLNMPGGSSVDAIPAIRAEAPNTHIVVLTMQEEPAFARQALAAGATGYVLKKDAGGELVEAVRRAAVGDTYLNPTLGARIAREPPPGPPDDLSKREIEVLGLISLGHTNGEIAGQLFLSVRTVETHRAHIQQKLRVSTRAELVRYAIGRGLVDNVRDARGSRA